MPPFGAGLGPSLLSLRPALTRWGTPLPSGGRRTGFLGTRTPASKGPHPRAPQRHPARLARAAGCEVRGLCCFPKAGHTFLTAQRFPGAGPFPGSQRKDRSAASRAAPRGPPGQAASAGAQVPPGRPALLFHSAASRPSCKPNLTGAH